MNKTEHIETSIESELFAVEEKVYGSEYKKHLLGQYKLYVEMADKICSRRSSANTFFLTANTFLVAIIGLSSKLEEIPSTVDLCWVVLASAAGILLSFGWYRIIRSYCQLSESKYLIINMIESRLPLAVYRAEWSYLSPMEEQPRYTQLTSLERYIPVIFAGLYLALMITGLCAILMSGNFLDS